jgi:hypothetical protein
MRRLSLLTALIWTPFVSIFVFAAQGDNSFWHISFHLFALPLLSLACRVAWLVRQTAVSTVQRVLAGILRFTVPLAVLGHALELVTAVARLARDDWRNRDTADLWERGPHVWASSLTIPAMLISMVVVLVLTAFTAVQARRLLEPVR